MKSFSLLLLAAERSERIDGVVSLVVEDASGSFGVLPQHERLISVLVFGLARLRYRDGSREYLGFPGALLYFVNNECRISTRRYLRDRDVGRIAETLGRELLAEEEALAETHRKLYRLESEMLRHLAELGRE